MPQPYHIIHVKGDLEVILKVLRLGASPASIVAAGPTLSRLDDGRCAGHRSGYVVPASHGTRRSSHRRESLARLPEADTLTARLGHGRCSIRALTPL